MYEKANDEDQKVEDLFEKLSGNPSKKLLALSREPAVPPDTNISKSPISLKPANKLPIASMLTTIMMQAQELTTDRLINAGKTYTRGVNNVVR